MTNEATAPALDEGARKILEILAEAQAKGVPALHEVSPDEARAMNLRSKELFGSEGPALEVRELELEGPAGRRPARLYRPGDGILPVVVYYHGGGWVIGSLDSHDGLCRHLAERSGAAVLSVDYRLAPEHPFPAAVEDAYAALEWVAARGAEHGLDTARIAVAGDSAGGNLAAVVALMARDRNGPSIALQALLYPATDMHRITESHRRFTEHLLTPESITWFQEHYLRSAADRDDWRASPLRAESHRGLPPAFVLTAGFDPLRDEGLAYARALREAGTEAAYRCFEGQIHGFLTLDKVISEASDAITASAEALRLRSRAESPHDHRPRAVNDVQVELWAASAELSVPPDPPRGRFRGGELDACFAALRGSSPRARRVAEETVWALWCDHPDPVAKRRMAEGIAALAREALETAEAVFDELVSAEPDWPEAWNKRATARFLLGRDAASVADVRRTLALEPRHFGALGGLAQIAFRNRNPEAARAALTRLLTVHPEAPGAARMLETIDRDGPPRVH